MNEISNTRRLASIALAAFMVLSTFGLILIPNLASVHAAAPVVLNTYTGNGTGATSFTLSIPSITFGQSWVVAVSGVTAAGLAFSIVDSLGLTLGGNFLESPSGNSFDVIYYANDTVAGSNPDTITIGTGSNGNPSGGAVFVVSGYIRATNHNTGHAATGTAITTASTSFSGSVLLVSTAIALAGGAVTLTGSGAGWTAGTLASGSQTIGWEQSTSASSPTTFPWTGSINSLWGDVGAVFAGTITQPINNLGLCPTSDTSTTTLVNQTLYYYQGLSLGQTVVTNVTTFLASTTTVATSQLLSLAVYVGTAGQPISAAFPLRSVGIMAFTITAGEKNQKLVYNINNFISTTNTPFAVGVYGTDKIKINQSGLAGMFTATGIGSNPPATISTATTNAAQLYLCGKFYFQSAVTSTTTQFVTTTITGTTTVTTTQGTGGDPTASTVGFSILLIILLAPAILLAGAIGFATKSGTGAMLGAFVGLVIGAGIGNLSGLVPLWMVGVTILGAVVLLVGMIAFARGES